MMHSMIWMIFLEVWGIYWLVRLTFLRSPFLSLRNVKYNMKYEYIYEY